MNKKYFLLVAIFTLTLSTLAPSGGNEMGYISFGSLSDDPFVLMKTIAAIELEDGHLSAGMKLQEEEIRNMVALRFSEEISALKKLKPELWETDKIFIQRVKEESLLLDETMQLEEERLKRELLAPLLEQQELIGEYAQTALTNLLVPRTLDTSLITIESNGIDRNTRIWSLSLSSRDKIASFQDIPVQVNFSTIRDELIIREEIGKFNEAVENNFLEITVDWKFMRDLYDEGFLLVIPSLNITNPLTGSTYASNIRIPILFKEYMVTGNSIDTLSVQDISQKEGISEHHYWKYSFQKAIFKIPEQGISVFSRSNPIDPVLFASKKYNTFEELIDIQNLEGIRVYAKHSFEEYLEAERIESEPPVVAEVEVEPILLQPIRNIAVYTPSDEEPLDATFDLNISYSISYFSPSLIPNSDVSEYRYGFFVNFDFLKQYDILGWGGSYQAGQSFNETEAYQTNLDFLAKVIVKLGGSKLSFPLSFSLGPVFIIETNNNNSNPAEIGLKSMLGAGLSYTVSDLLRVFYEIGVGATYNFTDKDSFSYIFDLAKIGIGFSF